jgi:2'-5' RNA ligase
MLRLFFALQPTAEQGEALATAVAPLLAQLGAQQVPAENLHVTLCFVGAVAEEKLDALKAAARGVRARALALHFDCIDYWAKPRILCATALDSASGSPAGTLSAQLANATVDAGFAPDAKPFRAHLTLARKVDATSAASGEWPRALASPVVVHCNRFVLMRSERGEPGSVYSVVAEWPLDVDNSRQSSSS